MTDKERLEIIKNKQMQMHILTSFDVDWLIERAQELENLKDAFDDLDSDYIDLQQENERYHDFIKTVTETTLIAYEIQKDNPNIKFITPHHLFDWITSNASELIGSDSK